MAPCYIYECQSCKDVIEKIQKFSDDPLKECEKCKGELKKQFTTPGGIHFKGSGFYATDYQKKKH